ncbi:RNA polymerase sigma factor [Mucilaginibacter litoreus]|uniref:RNA polymerase sigma factor n=1 Tax=Mucilaginibacter litoreus TaxID=1048221 RepID=A0ABW3AWH0_9SPHI
MDEEYIARVLAGDTDAFRYFLRAYQDMAFSLAMSVLKDEFAAQEAVQDAFLKAFDGLPGFSRQSAFKTWFYRIVLNEAFLRRKKQQKDFLEFREEYDADYADEALLGQKGAEEKTWLVNEALKRLPDREAVVLRLFYLEDESIRGTSEITGWSEANVKVILHRARKSMLAVINKLMKYE